MLTNRPSKTCEYGVLSVRCGGPATTKRQRPAGGAMWNVCGRHAAFLDRLRANIREHEALLGRERVRSDMAVTERVEIRDMKGAIVSYSTRTVCYETDGEGHHCGLDDGHETDLHHDDCCDHGEVTWPRAASDGDR